MATQEQIISQQISEVLVRFFNEDLKLTATIKFFEELVAEERGASADDKLWDYQCQQQQNLLWSSRTVGEPDLFSNEMRWFWDNGTWGNV
jgi:hypothetical protein